MSTLGRTVIAVITAATLPLMTTAPAYASFGNERLDGGNATVYADDLVIIPGYLTKSRAFLGTPTGDLPAGSSDVAWEIYNNDELPDWITFDNDNWVINVNPPKDATLKPFYDVGLQATYKGKRYRTQVTFVSRNPLTPSVYSRPTIPAGGTGYALLKQGEPVKQVWGAWTPKLRGKAIGTEADFAEAASCNRVFEKDAEQGKVFSFTRAQGNPDSDDPTLVDAISISIPEGTPEGSYCVIAPSQPTGDFNGNKYAQPMTIVRFNVGPAAAAPVTDYLQKPLVTALFASPGFATNADIRQYSVRPGVSPEKKKEIESHFQECEIPRVESHSGDGDKYYFDKATRYNKYVAEALSAESKNMPQGWDNPFPTWLTNNPDSCIGTVALPKDYSAEQAQSEFYSATPLQFYKKDLDNPSEEIGNSDSNITNTESEMYIFPVVWKQLEVKPGEKASSPVSINSNAADLGAPIEYSLGAGAPAWASIDAKTGELTVAPGTTVDPGSYTIPVTINNVLPDGYTQYQNLGAFVTIPGTPKDTTVVNWDAVTVRQGDTGTADPKGAKSGDTCALAVSDNDQWVSVDPNSCVVTYTPGTDVVPGQYNVPVMVTHSDGTTVASFAAVTVTQGEVSPTLEVSPTSETSPTTQSPVDSPSSTVHSEPVAPTVTVAPQPLTTVNLPETDLPSSSVTEPTTVSSINTATTVPTPEPTTPSPVPAGDSHFGDSSSGVAPLVVGGALAAGALLAVAPVLSSDAAAGSAAPAPAVVPAPAVAPTTHQPIVDAAQTPVLAMTGANTRGLMLGAVLATLAGVVLLLGAAITRRKNS